MRFTSPAIVIIGVAGSAAAQRCAPLELVYARATTEPPVSTTVDTQPTDWELAADKSWSKGYGAAGYSLLSNLTKVFPEAIGYPVHYPASSNFNTSGAAGVKDMLSHIEKSSAACPKMLFALGGHSQGSMVTVAVIPRLSKDILSRIIAVTMFGGRECPAEVKDRCKSYCNAGDTVCTPGAKSSQTAPKGDTPPKGDSSPIPPKDTSELTIPRGPYGPLADIPGLPKNGSSSPKLPTSTPPKALANAPPPKEATQSKGAPVEPKAPIPPADVPAIIVPEAVVPSPAPLPSPMKRQGKVIRGPWALTCDGPEAEEKGHVPSAAKSESAHTVYNKDGYYIQAAACYIYNRYKALPGGK